MNDAVWVLTIAAAVSAGTPLVFAATGEILAERSGVLNLGVEGMMLLGAVTAFLAAASGNPVVGLVAGTLAGGGLAAVHAFLSVTMRANQIVSGLALVIFGTGLATFLGNPIEGDPLGPGVSDLRIPLLADIPIVGRILFDQDPLVYVSWVVVGLAAFYLMRTRTGLALRACGESPETADAMGLSVARLRYAHVIVGGLLAGAGGAYQILARVPSWNGAGTTAGIGWIALALVVFAAWRPWRVLLGAYLFGVALAANFALQAAGVDIIPAEFLSMLPYLLTILVLIALSASSARKRLGAPAALGVPYAREER
ncbi:MAG: ABC transporter permease [Actinomycetota bacterium]|nr:ABC transporter permease [Actinomycetota bacterium]